MDDTLATVGSAVSITSALFAPSELLAPGAGRVYVAAFPAPSTMVPLFNDKAVVSP